MSISKAGTCTSFLNISYIFDHVQDMYLEIRFLLGLAICHSKLLLELFL